MSSNKIFAEYLREVQTYKEREATIRDRVQKGNRPTTDEEDQELRELELKRQISELRAAEAVRLYDPLKEAREAFRIAFINSRKANSITFKRDTMTGEDAEGAIPIKVNNVIEPITEGLIYKMLGIPISSGLGGSFYSWPVLEAPTATIKGEGTEVDPIKIDMNGYIVKPDTISAACIVSNEVLNSAAGAWDSVINLALPHAAQALINKILFTPGSQLDNADNLAGPFATNKEGNANYGVTCSLCSVPTIDELGYMLKTIMSNGARPQYTTWVMSEAMKIDLSLTAIGVDGIDGPILQDGKILGIPVYCSDCMEGYIGLGDFSFEPLAFFGETEIRSNPYKYSRYNATEYTLFTRLACNTLRPEVFALGALADSNSATTADL